MIVDTKRAIEFHQLAADALSAAADKHREAADAHKAQEYDKAKMLAAEARQLGHEAEVKSVSAAEVSAAPTRLPDLPVQEVPKMPPVHLAKAPWSLRGEDLP